MKGLLLSLCFLLAPVASATMTLSFGDNGGGIVEAIHYVSSGYNVLIIHDSHVGCTDTVNGMCGPFASGTYFDSAIYIRMPRSTSAATIDTMIMMNVLASCERMALLVKSNAAKYRFVLMVQSSTAINPSGIIGTTRADFTFDLNSLGSLGLNCYLQ